MLLESLIGLPVDDCLSWKPVFHPAWPGRHTLEHGARRAKSGERGVGFYSVRITVIRMTVFDGRGEPSPRVTVTRATGVRKPASSR